MFAQLTDADEGVRAIAREELALAMDDEIARAFLDIASSDADEEIRADVIVGLGPIIDEAGIDYGDGEEFEFEAELGPGITQETFGTIVREIRELYESEAQPKLIRRRAMEVLVRDPRPWMAAEIRRHFAGDDQQWKMTSVFAMGYLRGFDDEIAATVSSERDLLLYEAVRSAGRMQVAAAAPRIRELAASESTESDLRLAAIDALPSVDPDCRELLETLKHSSDAEVADSAAAALEELNMFETSDEDDDDFGYDDDEEDEIEEE